MALRRRQLTAIADGVQQMAIWLTQEQIVDKAEHYPNIRRQVDKVAWLLRPLNGHRDYNQVIPQLRKACEEYNELADLLYNTGLRGTADVMTECSFDVEELLPGVEMTDGPDLPEALTPAEYNQML